MAHKLTHSYTHRCAAPDCAADVPSEVLMCFAHWKRVPKPLARKVTMAWRRFRDDPFDQAARDDYNAAREAAIAALEEPGR